jgi:hypothetical protein
MRQSYRSELLKQIERNIKQSGQHIYAIFGGPAPRYAYTIGLTEVVRAELVLAGCAGWYEDEVGHILNAIGDEIRTKGYLGRRYVVDGFGSFSLQRAHASWTDRMLHGAHDYYRPARVRGYQVLPDGDHFTIDIPDLAQQWSRNDGAWRWLCDRWTRPIPESSFAMVDPGALRGEPIREVARWEDDYWEAFSVSPSELREEDARPVPLSVLVDFDPSLAPIFSLAVGSGMSRTSADARWKPWTRASMRPRL